MTRADQDRAPGTPGVGARATLAGWVESQDEWIRWIVGEVLASSKPMGDGALDEAYGRLLAEKGLTAEVFSAVPAGAAPAAGEPLGDPLVLLRLEACSGVNALAEDQVIEFNERMTVLFGENSAGKSGYVRILKRAANVRSAEPVLPNIYTTTEGSDPTARLVYKLGDEEHASDWSNEEGVAPFTRVSIFDSRAVALHLDEDLTYLFTPSDLALFTHVHAAIEAVRAKAEVAVAEARPRANPFINRFQRGTEIYREVEALGASSDLARLEGLGAVPEDVEEQVARRRARVDALRPEAVASRLEMARTDRQLYQTLVSVCDAVITFDAEAYSAALVEIAQATTDYGRLTEAVLGGLGVTARRDEWEEFVRAGERVLRAADRADYPQSGDTCIYCQQEIDHPGVARVQSYRSWINDESAARRDAAERRATEVSAAVRAVGLSTLAERIVAKAAAFAQDAPPVIATAGHVVGQLAAAEALLEGKQPVVWGAIAEGVETLRPLVVAALENAIEVVTALEAQETERTAAFEAERIALAELEAASTLSVLLPDVRQFIERTRWSDRLSTLLKPITGLLRSLTETAKAASDELLNRGFEEQFAREIEMLRAPRLRLDFPGRRGQAARRKSLVPDHRLSEILSESEQKVIALADFLAEASLRPTAAPFILDDPVTSLDYKRLDHVVDRLWSLSRDEQVIVFTHNIWFAVELLSRFEREPGACAYYDITRTEDTTGIVTGGSHPRADTVRHLKGEINSLIQDAATMSGESQAALIERAYDKVRAWCEVVVEEELLRGVTKRHQPNVQMTRLTEIRIDRLEQAIRELFELFEKACRVMGGHSQPLETLAVRPDLDELRKDWEDGQAARDAYVAA